MRYDGKEYVESLSKVRREKSATGALQIGESEDEVTRIVARSAAAIH